MMLGFTSLTNHKIMTIKKGVEKKSPIEISPQEFELLNAKRKEEETARACASEIAEVLKKYNMHLDTSKPQIIVTMNRNA